jgi:hypothetical protein
VRKVTWRVKFFNSHMSALPGMEKRGVADARGRAFVLSFG